MNIVKETLLADLSKAMAGIASGTVQMDGADSLYFKDGYVHSYNSAVSATVKLSQEMNVNGIVNAKDLYDCVKKLPSDFELTEQKDVWELKCGKIKVKIKLLEVSGIEERFKDIEPKDAWSPINGEDFNKALCICDMPQNKSKVSGLFCKEKTFVSTDMYTMNVYKADDEYPTFFINNSAVAELKKWKNFNAIQMNRTWLQFKTTDDVVFSVKTLFADKYPYDNIQKIIKATESFDVVIEEKFVSELFDAINRAQGFSDIVEEFNAVTLSYTKDGLIVKSERSAGAYEEVVDSIKSDVEFETIVNIGTFVAVKGIFDSFKIVSVPNKETKRYVLSSDKAMCVIASLTR